MACLFAVVILLVITIEKCPSKWLVNWKLSTVKKEFCTLLSTLFTFLEIRDILILHFRLKKLFQTFVCFYVLNYTKKGATHNDQKKHNCRHFIKQ